MYVRMLIAACARSPVVRLVVSCNVPHGPCWTCRLGRAAEMKASSDFQSHFLSAAAGATIAVALALFLLSRKGKTA